MPAEGEYLELPTELRVAAARCVLYLAEPEYLAGVADRALAAGVYSQALFELWQHVPPPDSSGLTSVVKSSWGEVYPLFLRALRELGIGLPGLEEAAWTVARETVRSIVASPGSLRELLQFVYWLSDTISESVPHDAAADDVCDLDRLVSLYHCYFEVGDPVEVDTLAKTEASKWLERHEQR